MPAATKYAKQRPRPKVTPPHAPVRALRLVGALTIDQLIERIRETTGKTFTRGAICAVEKGHRGASPDLLRAIEQAYGLPEGMLVTNYEPNLSRRPVAA